MNTKLTKTFLLLAVVVLSMLLLEACNSNKSLNKYKGTPYKDKVYSGGAQIVPGKLQCEYYDLGGEGIAFHDTDSVNSGSGRLNKADGSYLHGFRINEAVDISYTKFQDPPIDNSPYNFVEPEKDQLYVGWTKPGEWLKYTISVEKEGKYKLGLMFTSNKNGKISFSINDEKVTNSITIPSTFVSEDSVAFRQWHHWNYMEDLATIQLKKGIQTFTIHTDEVGDINYEHINFDFVN